MPTKDIHTGRAITGSTSIPLKGKFPKNQSKITTFFKNEKINFAGPEVFDNVTHFPTPLKGTQGPPNPNTFNQNQPG